VRTLVTKLLRLVLGSLGDEIAGDANEGRWSTGKLAAVGIGTAARRSRVPRFTGAAGDLKYAVRSLRKSPWFSATVVLVIALGMALATTVFAVVDGVLFKPLPYPDGGRLFAIRPGFMNMGTPRDPLGASLVDLAHWSAAVPEAGITGFYVENNLVVGDAAQSSYGVARVQPNFFDVIGVRPLIGGFSGDDFQGDLEHMPLVRPAVISYELWQTRFRGAADVIGQTILTDASRGSGYRVTGVMPDGFLFPTLRSSVRLITPFLPFQRATINPRNKHLHELIARVPDGMSRGELRDRIEAGMAVAAAAYPAPTPAELTRGRLANPYDRADLLSLDTAMGARERPLFAAIFLAAAVLVAIGAINVSGLLAARCLDRARELGLRRALGAGGAGIARLVVFEALVLIAAGCAIGLALAPSLLQIGLSLLPSGLRLLKTPAIDWRVAGFVVTSALALTVPTTIWPIRRALRMQAGAIADGARGSERRRSAGRFIVVMSQVTGGAALTIIGALLVSSMLRLYAIPPNVRTEDVVVIPAFMQGSNVAAERLSRIGAIIERLRAIPGAAGAAAAAFQGLRGGNVKGWFNPPPNAANPNADVVVLGVTPEFYRVVGLELVSGRFPTSDELAADQPVTVVGEGIQRAYFPGISPVGQMLTFGEAARPFRVVGVVKDVRWLGMDLDMANIYCSFTTLPTVWGGHFFVRAASDVGAMKVNALSTIEKADALVQPMAPVTLADRFSDSVRARRLQAWLFGAFAASALAIVGVGIFGLMAMAMARRRREVGLRMALGSTRQSMIALLMREQLAAVVTGLVAGCAIAAWAGRFMSWFLYELSAFDIGVWAVALSAILLMAAAGTLIPSLRASKVDPVQALRND
jgi:putative ABC transport system permease protein